MMIIIELISQKSLKQSLASFPPSLIIHISVDIVYVGIKSPMKDMNSIGFIPVANLLLVFLNRRAVVITLNIISPITGTSNTGAAT